MNSFLFPGHRIEWLMGRADKIGMLHILRLIQPEVAIEIGTYKGGSLQVITRYSQKVYSIDIGPTVAQELAPHFDKVEFLTGDSGVMITTAINRINALGEALQFVLIDGDHSEEGVRKDINLVLQYRPRKTMCIVLHDSFNPEVRRGILAADWSSNPHVAFVEVDYMPSAGADYGGKFNSSLWGGLALAVLQPEIRSGDLYVGEESKALFGRERKAFGE